MNPTVKAIIRWTPREAGGRQAPPVGPRYSTVAHFAEDQSDIHLEAWGIVAEFDEAQTRTDGTLVRIRFLSSDGPVQYLHPGSRFELYEGKQVVARGEVLAEAEQLASISPPAAALVKENPVNAYMTTSDTQPSIEALNAELAEKEEALRKLVRQIDQISRTEFRDRAQRLRMMRDQRTALESAIDALKTKLTQAGQ
ncbi:MAG: hypothetical protein HZB53_20545 [Chloroflexi bacterium]|nr:hypothetical protein [Chloroflexota bacterium]